MHKYNVLGCLTCRFVSLEEGFGAHEAYNQSLRLGQHYDRFEQAGRESSDREAGAESRGDILL